MVTELVKTRSNGLKLGKFSFKQQIDRKWGKEKSNHVRISREGWVCYLRMTDVCMNEKTHQYSNDNLLKDMSQYYT